MPGRAERSDAFVLRSIDYRDADRIVTLLTARRGTVSVLARGARRSHKRFGGALEPFLLLDIALAPTRGSLWRLDEARVVRAFPALLRSLEAMQRAGSAFELLRKVLPEGQAEPRAFEEALALLDALEAGKNARVAALVFKVRLLAISGVWPDLQRCSRCGRIAPSEKAVLVDPTEGAICRACGGGELYLRAALRQRLVRAVAVENDVIDEAWEPGQVEEVSALVDALTAQFVGSSPAPLRRGGSGNPHRGGC